MSFADDEGPTTGNARRTTHARIARVIRALPPGKVSTYGAVARAAGFPGAARQVVRVLRQVPGLPWHRVLGSGGAIKLPGESGAEQRFRLRMEGVAFRGARLDMKRHEFDFSKAWAAERRQAKVPKRLSKGRSVKPKQAKAARPKAKVPKHTQTERAKLVRKSLGQLPFE